MTWLYCVVSRINYLKNKKILDDLLNKYKAQPVGNGYIDIIVMRDNFKNLIIDLLNNNYEIRSVSWWEFCKKDEESLYGLGGPESIFYNGWFSEIPIDIDDISNNIEIDSKLQNIFDIIINKVVQFPDNDVISFKKNDCLIPALWLNVPKDWKNNIS